MTTKSLGISENYSKTADNIIYRVDETVIPMANKEPIGSVSLEQLSRGISTPSVQSAIDNLSSMVFTDVGGVVVNTTGVSPSGSQQTTRATFSGTVNIRNPLDASQATATTTRTVNILGVYVSLLQGETADHVATKFADALTNLSTKQIAVDVVQQNTTSPTIVDFRHMDYSNHSFETIYINGITVTFSVLSPAKYGYGDWFKIGQEDKTLGGNSSKITFHYYQRLS